MNRIDGDFYVGGTLRAAAFDIPASTLVNADVNDSAAIDASKLTEHHAKEWNQSGTAADETKVLHTVRGATGTVKSFDAGSITLCTGSATVTLDLKKNGASILNTPIVLDTGNTARTVEEAAIDTTAVVVDDVLEIVVTTANPATDTLATGCFAELRLDESYPI